MLSHLFRRLAAVSFTQVLAAGAIALATTGPIAAADDMIAVNVDQAKLVKFPDKIATIVVGNPLIADVTLQPGGMVVVTGKGYGATNVIAMDRSGAILMDRLVQVEGPVGKIVTVYRGINRESYSCATNCERRVTLGDADAFFNTTMQQAGAIGGQAATVGAAVAAAPGRVN